MAENSSHGKFVNWGHSLLILSFPKCTKKLIHCFFLTPSIQYITQNYLHFNQNLAFLSHFFHPFFIAWVTLFSFFPSLNALKNLSIVLFNPSIQYITQNYLHFNQNLAFLSHFNRDDHATNFPYTVIIIVLEEVEPSFLLQQSLYRLSELYLYRRS